ncbi:hypothetical protein FOA52_012377 [Chlamydomonas sp. UWO 241]|nr:hypothetical protein FOA52_012377 [Chlamydomonas sp. UWO 241]
MIRVLLPLLLACLLAAPAARAQTDACAVPTPAFIYHAGHFTTDLYALAVHNFDVYASTSDATVLKFDLALGIAAVYAGTEYKSFSGEGGPATSATLRGVTGLAVDGQDNLFICADSRVLVVDAATKIITTVAGGGTASDSDSDGGLATSAALQQQGGVAVNAAGDVFLTDYNSSSGIGSVRKVSGGIITTVVGDLGRPQDLAIDDAGNLFITNGSDIIKWHAATGTTAIVANVLAAGLAVNGAGTVLYSKDNTIGYIRAIDLVTNMITTVAGTNSSTKDCDVTGGPALETSVCSTDRISFYGCGELLYSGSGLYRLRAPFSLLPPMPPAARPGQTPRSSDPVGETRDVPSAHASTDVYAETKPVAPSAAQRAATDPVVLWLSVALGEVVVSALILSAMLLIRHGFSGGGKVAAALPVTKGRVAIAAAVFLTTCTLVVILTFALHEWSCQSICSAQQLQFVD